jgi:cell fate regulator YaaT (PSP1 superfamily)
MSRVMAVAFEPHGQLHYLDPADADCGVDDWVLFPTSAGTEVARVVWAPSDASVEGRFPVCPGKASRDDIARDRRNRANRTHAAQVARRLVAEHDLDMKVLAVDWMDHSKGTGSDDLLVAIYFQAPKRVDFRRLVSDLARELRARIDLRQVGARDATRLTGGVGSCGRELCCSTWLTEYEPISLRVARNQDLQMNPMAISGQCGKLLCCLRFEQEQYRDFAKRAPEIGASVVVGQRHGTVIGHQVPAGTVTVRDDAGQVCACKLGQVNRTGLTQRVMAAASSVARIADWRGAPDDPADSNDEA